MTLRIGGYWTCEECGARYHSSRIHSCGDTPVIKPVSQQAEGNLVDVIRDRVKKGSKYWGETPTVDQLTDCLADIVNQVINQDWRAIQSIEDLPKEDGTYIFQLDTGKWYPVDYKQSLAEYAVNVWVAWRPNIEPYVEEKSILLKDWIKDVPRLQKENLEAVCITGEDLNKKVGSALRRRPPILNARYERTRRPK